MRVVNVFDAELREGPGRDGFWHRGAPLGESLGASRIGAGLYEARAGVPIWPFHYHYPAEEWLYVLEGAPVLRELSGRRALTAGDLARFPPGHRGAHTIEGPGRFVVFSHHGDGPFVSVYPDSDKVSISPGIESDRLNSLLLPRSGAVGYWHGEGSGPDGPVAVTREPDGVDAVTVVNVDALPLEAKGAARRTALTEPEVTSRLDGAFVELDDGGDCGPYRYDVGRELWLFVLSGMPTVRHPEGERTLSAGDLACLPEGPAGARAVLNRSGGPARMLLLWTTGFPTAAHHPDTGEWVLRAAPGDGGITLRDAPRAPSG